MYSTKYQTGGMKKEIPTRNYDHYFQSNVVVTSDGITASHLYNILSKFVCQSNLKQVGYTQTEKNFPLQIGLRQRLRKNHTIHCIYQIAQI